MRAISSRNFSSRALTWQSSLSDLLHIIIRYYYRPRCRTLRLLHSLAQSISDLVIWNAWPLTANLIHHPAIPHAINVNVAAADFFETCDNQRSDKDEAGPDSSVATGGPVGT